MSSVVIAGNTSGTVTLLAPDIAGTTTLTLPTTSGTVVVAGGAQTIEFADGSASSPSITNSGDTNTGIFFPAADTIGFSEGGAESMRIDSSGNVQVGMTSGARKLNVQGYIAAFNTGGGNDSHIALYNDGTTSNIASTYTSTGSYLPMAFQTGGSERMRIDSSGNVIVGGTSALGNTANRGNITLNGTSSALYSLGVGGVLKGFLNHSGTNMELQNTAEGFLAIATNATERMRISSAGVVGIGQDASAYGQFAVRFDATTGVNNSLGIGVSPVANTSNAVYVRFYNATGNGCGDISRSGTSNAVVYGTTSDYRLKENVQPMTGALAKVAQLNPVTYTWIDSQEQAEGFLAHEVQTVIPTAVVGEKDATQIQSYEISPAVPATYDEEGNELTPAVEAVMGEREVPKYQNMDTSYLVATLTAAIQEQQALITDLTTRLTALENK
jgi:hypothetical protein